jgi:hypothetical protein
VLSDDVVKVADAVEFSGCETNGLPLSLKVTVPVGTPEVEGVTVAVNVTDWLGLEGSGEALRAVVVGAIVTV